MDTNALFKIGYGLYVLTVNDGNKDSGCIINTVMQVTSEPCQIAIAVNKQNYSAEIIQKNKKFNISVLTEDAPFDIFKRFGFQSGRNTDKFAGFSENKKSLNGLLYITQATNSFMSCYVKQEHDLGSHILFIAQLVAADVLSDRPTVSYDYYQKNIKPKPQTAVKKGWRCKICNYIYEGDEIPQDFICPICKHGVADFEKI